MEGTAIERAPANPGRLSERVGDLSDLTLALQRAYRRDGSRMVTLRSMRKSDVFLEPWMSHVCQKACIQT